MLRRLSSRLAPLILLISVLGIACSSNSLADADYTDLAQTTIAASDFTAVDVVTGKTISLSQFRGSVVLLNFVNYGCSPAQNEPVSRQLLAIRRLSEQRHDFVPISVFCGCCPPDVLRDFALQNDLDWPWILDTEYSIVLQYADYINQYGYPTLVYIDRAQYLKSISGYSDDAGLSAKIDEISQQEMA